jgi:NAD(P)-dependent dehydrogenase (short-subunit alcohol dehydrogenase family)
MSDHSVDVVVGAASGMGAAVARRLAAAGSSGSSGSGRLLLADVDLDGAERLAAELGAGAEAHRCDLTSADDLAALAGAVAPGSLGALVMTAGLSPTMAPGRRILEVDLVGPAHLVAVFGEVATVGSAALLFASMASHLVPPDPGIDAALATPLAPGFLDDLAAAGVDVDDPGAAYAYAKRGVRRLVEREAAGWGRRGARLLSLSPGVIDTPMGRQENEAQPLMATMVEGSALGRVITADEVAAVAAFLVGDAAGVLTGTDVLVDGGAVAALLHPSA